MSLPDPIRLVAFDVDGTLLGGPTICECIAAGIGRSGEMAAFERLTAQADIACAREVMAEWYRGHEEAALLAQLGRATWAPGLKDGFRRLRSAGVKIALVSITWRQAVEALAERWGADYAIGTGMTGGGVEHFWPDDKPVWLSELRTTLGLVAHEVAAVGDSASDLPMLASVGRGYFVGRHCLALPPHVEHWPDADIGEIVTHLLGE
jgi:HAD superfamily phosphoserine phosphatase-like hydrolase